MVEAACDTLTAWIGARDLAIAGPPREVYLSEPETPPEQVRTIVEFPVVEVAAPVPISLSRYVRPTGRPVSRTRPRRRGAPRP